MDAESGEVLWERNANEPLPPASTTKVMTAILALESDRLDESFRVSSAAAAAPPSRINLRAGQRSATFTSHHSSNGTRCNSLAARLRCGPEQNTEHQRAQCANKNSFHTTLHSMDGACLL